MQLRIEAQGKYLKKIIEEQQRLSGVFVDPPGSGAVAPELGEKGQESENKTDPATPVPTSECPDKAAKERAPANSLSIDESFSSHHEPLTPDSGCPLGSLAGSPHSERSKKKQRVGESASYAKSEMVLPHEILESSLSSSFQHSNSNFLAQE